MTKYFNSSNRKKLAGVAAIALTSGALMFGATGIYRLSYSHRITDADTAKSSRSEEARDADHIRAEKSSEENS